jgi:hypothetical protein
MTMTTTTKTGYVACDYTQSDVLSDVRHGEIRETEQQAIEDARPGYEGVRYVGSDGYLYVERPE